MRIKVAYLFAVAMSLGVSQVASAADMPAKAPAYSAASVAAAYNWTGLYIGANAGYSWGNTYIDYTTPFATPSNTLHPDSFIGGGQIGYNWQMGATVLGLEADIAWRHGSKDSTFLFGATPTAGNPFGSVAGDNTVFHTEQNWLGTVRGRIGYAVGSWLPYATGGLAYGNVNHSITETLVAPDQSNTRTISESRTKAGWTLGGGVEYGYAGPWSVGLEYLYVNLGTSTLNQPAQTILVAFPADTGSFKDTSHIVRLKMNYRFGMN